MAKYIIDETTLQNLANAIRKVNGETKSYTPTEMIEAVTNIMESATYILVDENGNEVPAVYVDSEQVFTATANDIRIGTVAANNDGIVEGEKEIPAYYVTEGYRLITNGSTFATGKFDYYDFTKLQCIICPFSGSIDASVVAEKVVIGDSVYSVNSNTVISTVVRDSENENINLGLTNTSGGPYVLRYFTYKEVQ